jgi:oligosaccharyltransferase complex subunit alpha (ribophorin I)
MRVLVLTFFLSSAAQWVNRNIVRELSVRDNGIVESTTVYTVEKTGGDKAFIYKLSVPHASRIGSLRITAGGKDVKTELESTDEKTDVAVYSVTGVETNIQVKAYQGAMLSPYPTKIMELETQQVMLTTVFGVPSVYGTTSQTVTVTLPANAGEINSHFPENAKKLSGKKVEFTVPTGFKKTDMIKVHFAFDQVLPILTSVMKTIEVSQLGQVVAVNEDITLVNRAAGINGEFSRSPYMHMKYAQGNVPFTLGHTLQSIDAVVPETAFDIHYRDVIGNISSSNAKRDMDLTRVSLRPRFPLSGGWKSEFYFMYNLPFDAEFVRQKQGRDEFMLAGPVGHSLANVFAQNVDVRIILPAGASDIKISVPGREVSNLEIQKMFGWLDTPLLGSDSGRTVLSFSTGPFVAGERNSLKPTLLVTYTLSPVALLKAPILLTFYILALFMVFIFSRRMVLTISNPKEDSEEENKNADHDLCQQIDDELTNLWALTGELLDAVAEESDKETLSKFKQSFNVRYAEIVSIVESITPQFTVENNRVNRTVKLMLALKAVKDSASAVLEAAIAGRDFAIAAGKLVDAEMDAKNILEKVEAGAPPSAPSTPSGNQVGTTVTPAATAIKKRR